VNSFVYLALVPRLFDSLLLVVVAIVPVEEKWEK
jgi:hypothetical protein